MDGHNSQFVLCNSETAQWVMEIRYELRWAEETDSSADHEDRNFSLTVSKVAK